MNALDKAIQQFTAYARGHGDFDELDLKEVVEQEIAKARTEEHDYFIGLTFGVHMVNPRIAKSLMEGIKRRKDTIDN